MLAVLIYFSEEMVSVQRATIELWNNYPRSTFGGKVNSSWRLQTAKRIACLRSFFCFLYGNARSKTYAALKEIELMGI